jgi:hypothetical protein
MDFQGTWRHIMALYWWLKRLWRVDFFFLNIFFYESGTPTLEKCGNLHIRGTLIYDTQSALHMTNTLVENTSRTTQELISEEK